jgi:hypothetical protein
MTKTKLAFILTLLVITQIATSGYRFRCYAFCKDQTSVQDEYTEQRDHCRRYAQLKSEMSSFSGEDKDRKAQLITMFSDCMSRRGWVVPDGRDGRPLPPDGIAAAGPAAAGVGASAAGAPQQDPVAAEQERRAFIARASECNFARQNTGVSSNAAARAKACDLECEHRLSAAPDAPRPAACPAEISDVLSTGHD